MQHNAEEFERVQELREQLAEEERIKAIAEGGNLSGILAERGKQYGYFHSHAQITQDIKTAMHGGKNWDALPDDMREALDMVAHKIGRILNGNIHHVDSWVDAQGYLKLVSDRLQGVKR